MNRAAGIDNADVLLTDARAKLLNTAAYAQYGFDLLEGHLHIDAGLRLDHFRFSVDDLAAPSSSGTRTAARWQPKFSVSYWPTSHLPAVLFLNYGRGVSSQDARGVVQQPDAPAVSTTDFYQARSTKSRASPSPPPASSSISRTSRSTSPTTAQSSCSAPAAPAATSCAPRCSSPAASRSTPA